MLTCMYRQSCWNKFLWFLWIRRVEENKFRYSEQRFFGWANVTISFPPACSINRSIIKSKKNSFRKSDNIKFSLLLCSVIKPKLMSRKPRNEINHDTKNNEFWSNSRFSRACKIIRWLWHDTSLMYIWRSKRRIVNSERKEKHGSEREENENISITHLVSVDNEQLIEKTKCERWDVLLFDNTIV